MASKSFWAALGGVGQGAQFWGQMAGRDALAEAQSKRTFSRQQKLQEISQKWREGLRDEERQYALQQITPGNEVYGVSEAHRQKLRTEGLEDQQDLITHRADAYGYGSGGRSSRLLSTMSPLHWTPETWGPFIKEVETQVGAGADPDAAARRAMIKHPLEPRQEAGSSQATVRFVTDQMSLMLDTLQTSGPEELIAALVQLGYPEEQLTGMEPRELLALYQREMQQYGSLQGGGLMSDPGFDMPTMPQQQMPDLDPLGWNQ
jgi:hypothetical protein